MAVQASAHLFDNAVQTAHAWINELQERLGWRNKRRTLRALRAVLHALRDRLTIEESAQLAAQLPLLVRGLFYEGWRPAGKPLKERTKKQFLAHVAHEMNNEPHLDFEETTRAVFGVLEEHVSRGEVEDVLSVLPHDLQDLWMADGKDG